MIGWYLGVVTDSSQPVQQDYLALYVGQSINISKRVKRHLIDRRHKFSAQYEVSRRGDKRVQYVTLGTISQEDVTKEEQKAIMVRCGRCRGTVGQDRVPLYARDGSGYIVRRFVCKECRNSGHGRAYFYPIDPQIQYEQMPRYKVKYYRAHPDLRAEDGGPRDSAGPYGARKWTGNLRTRLLGNRFFHCQKPESQPGGRVFFREVTITVPEAAGFDCDVRVRCDLKRAGEVHPNVCAIDTVPEDPARRLGIEVTYRDSRDGSEKSSWCFLGGEQSAKKLNSLVDFLEQKPDGYTVQQPRRCLPKRVKYGRSKVTYTS